MTEGRQRKKPRNKNEVQRFWNFVPDEESNTAEMLLYGEISEYSWYGDEITPSIFNQELKDLGAVDEITVRINSGGGDVFAAVAIYTRLKEHKAKISVKIDGWCASAATIIAMAGDTIEISVGGVFMIHDPLAGLIGYYNTTDLENIVKELETIKQSIVNCYMTVTDKSEEEIKSLMTNEGEWFTGEEAVEAGFCTAVMFTDVDTEVENEEKVIVNSVPIGLERFSTIPKGLLGYANSHNNNYKTNGKNKEDNNMTYSDVPAWKNNNNITQPSQLVTWPKYTLGGKIYHSSVHQAGVMSKTDATEDLGGGSPCESASNKTIQIDGMALADGTEVLLDLVKANYLNSNGIITALNLTGSFVSWGNETACYPANTDVTDYFYCVSRMFSWVANSVILSMWSKVDKKLNKRLIESVTQSINIWLNGLMAEEKILGGRVEFLEEENTTADLLAGKAKFHIYLTPPSPAKELDFVLEYDVSYLENIFA